MEKGLEGYGRIICSNDKFPGTIIIGILRFVISLLTREVIIGPGFLLFGSVLAAKTRTLIFFPDLIIVLIHL